MKAFSHARAFVERLFSRVDPATITSTKEIPAHTITVKTNPATGLTETPKDQPRVSIRPIMQRLQHRKHRGYCKGAFGSAGGKIRRNARSRSR